MVSQARNRATAKYIKTHMKRYVLQFSNERDADIIALVEKQDNKTDYIRQLLRKEVEK